jgi:RimJ/RimL family protein N-acetyltransferase
MMHTIYTGPRVRIRPHASKEEGFELVRQTHLMITPGWGPLWYPLPALIPEWEESGWMGGEYLDFAIEELASGQAVGYFSVIPPQQFKLDGGVATFIAPPYRRRGYGVEAKQLGLCCLFENYAIERAGAVTVSNHTAARRGLELAGFTLEGSFRGTQFSVGRRVDKVLYWITREQWEQLPIRQIVRRG